VIELTPRQREVVVLVTQGLTYAEIGRRLGISAETVRVHVFDVAQKGGARSGFALRWVIANADRLTGTR
jgi:DNA-binding NarL/FixJ family response regulator